MTVTGARLAGGGRCPVLAALYRMRLIALERLGVLFVCCLFLSCIYISCLGGEIGVSVGGDFIRNRRFALVFSVFSVGAKKPEIGVSVGCIGV